MLWFTLLMGLALVSLGGKLCAPQPFQFPSHHDSNP